MTFTSLQGLRNYIKDFANRKDLSDSRVTSFINLAQDRATRVLRIPVLEGYNENLSISSEGDISLPQDYIEAKQLTIEHEGCTYELERKPLSFMTAIRSKTGVPKYFARRGNKLLLAPLNDDITTAQLYYYISLDPLENTLDTNWFVENAADILIYGALAEIALFTKNPEEAQMFEAKFRGAASEIENMANKAEFSGSSLRINPQG
jgi:hypothetical protein